MFKESTHQEAKTQLNQRLFTINTGVKQRQMIHPGATPASLSRTTTPNLNMVDQKMVNSYGRTDMSMSMNSNKISQNKQDTGLRLSSSNNYASIRPTRNANISMSIGGQYNATGPFKRTTYQPQMVMGPTVKTRPKKKIRTKQTVMKSEFYGEAEDFFVEGDGPVDPKEDYLLESLDLKDMNNMQRVQRAKLITAIKTPYTQSGRIDLNAYDKLIQGQIKAGVDGIIVAGTTGEGHLMNWDENLTLIEYCVAEYGDKLCIIGNTGSNSTRECIKATSEGFQAGMHGALQINPYYGKTSAKGIKYHLDAAMEYGPAVIYNVASRTAQDMSPEIVEHLAKNPNFAGMKECSGHERIKQYSDQGILCWSGNDDECHDSKWKYGGHGVISVTSNVLPGVMRRLMDKQDDELNAKVQPFMNWLFLEPNPIGLNTVSAMTGAAEPVFRAPYMPYDLDKRLEAIELLSAFKDWEIQGERRPVAMDDGDFKVLADWARGVCKVKEDYDGERRF